MHQKVCRQLNLSWGVTPLVVQRKDDADELFEHAVNVAEKAGLVSMGDITVITAGVPLGVRGSFWYNKYLKSACGRPYPGYWKGN